MMFASRTPRDLNRDPMPYQVWSTPEPGEGYYCGVRALEPHFTGTSYTVFAPRDYYDHAQHNAPNPILVEFRESVRARGEDAYWGDTWDSTTAWLDDAAASDGYCLAHGITDAHITHARTVLTRLQAVDWAAWRAPRLDPA